MAIKQGFSLIELVIVIGLLSLLSLAISSIMLTSIMSSNRLRTATRVKQAGDYALNQIQQMVRSARSVVSCDSDNNIIQIIGPDGGLTSLTTESDGTNTRIASNSGIYLTPGESTTKAFRLTCNPTDSTPTLVNIAFDLQDTHSNSTSTVENPTIHFETSINLRNE